MKLKQFLYSSVMIIFLIVIIALLFQRYNYSEYNQAMVQIVANEGIEADQAAVYDQNTLLHTIDDFSVNDIEKIGNMIYYIGDKQIYYQSLTGLEQIDNFSVPKMDTSNTVITRGLGNEIFFTFNADKQQNLCSSELDFNNINCVEIEVDQIDEIVFDNNHIYVLGTNEEVQIILKKFDLDLNEVKSLDIGEAKGQIGMLDSQYIFDISSDGLTVYEENKSAVTYKLVEYKIDNNTISLQDEFVYNGDYYFVTNDSLIRIKDKQFEQVITETLFDQYLYHDYYNLYYIRDNEVIRYNLTSQHIKKTKIKNRGGIEAMNYYISK